MKIFKGLSLSDQKILAENYFIWNAENGEKPERNIYKSWILAFFQPEHITRAIDDMQCDISLTCNDVFFDDLNATYGRIVAFLKSELNKGARL